MIITVTIRDSQAKKDRKKEEDIIIIYSGIHLHVTVVPRGTTWYHLVPRGTNSGTNSGTTWYHVVLGGTTWYHLKIFFFFFNFFT